jgi:hypothetical protein
MHRIIMEEKILPPIQLVLAVVFGMMILLGPVVTPEIRAILIASALSGVLLGLVTLRIGWLVVVDRQYVEYPFQDWSQQVVKTLFDTRPVVQRSKYQSSPTFGGSRVIGLLSLVTGGILVLGMGGAFLYVFLQLS